jgi:RNA polymerase sigma factor (sigma-70 family)
MKTVVEHDPRGDSHLVELCLRGDRNAFAQIVERHQSTICAIAYSGCGDIGRSEDLAQDTFVAAWKSLGELKEPERLKAWLCGIARNLMQNAVRRQQRVPTAGAVPLMPEPPSDDATPLEEAISKEEEALMWRALETIPETYREPMVLFYRENQSTQAVADALDISEEAVRQRLARGRVMLAERVAKSVETALIRSRPGKVFTLGVLAAVPPTAFSAKAAAVSAAAAKGSATAIAPGLVATCMTLIGPLFAFLMPYTLYRIELDDAQSPQRRVMIRRWYAILGAGMGVFAAVVLALGALEIWVGESHPGLCMGLWVAAGTAYLLSAGIFFLWSTRWRRMHLPTEPVPSQPLYEYRSRITLLGLPLVHIRLRGGAKRGSVKAWFAVGPTAIGVVFAFGGIAIAPLSMGGIAMGLLPIGGIAVGLAAFGAFCIGVWALGMFVAGWQASGFCAAGWLAADGVWCSAAHGFARGSAALATHVNDAAATAFFNGSRFYRAVTAVFGYSWLLYLTYLFPLVVWRWVSRRNRRTKGASKLGKGG